MTQCVDLDILKMQYGQQLSFQVVLFFLCTNIQFWRLHSLVRTLSHRSVLTRPKFEIVHPIYLTTSRPWDFLDTMTKGQFSVLVFCKNTHALKLYTDRLGRDRGKKFVSGLWALLDGRGSFAWQLESNPSGSV